jgi:hypothetical protein
MVTTPRRTAGATVVMAVLGCTCPASAGESSTAAVAVTTSDQSMNAHVRSDSAAIVALMARASDTSTTFRQLVEAIETSGSVVYIQGGACLDNARACFVSVTMAGSRRNLWVRVTTKVHDNDCDLMGSIAHELRHTVEVLDVSIVTSTAALVAFYRWYGVRGSARTYETQAAIDAGNAVRSECSRQLSNRRQ